MCVCMINPLCMIAQRGNENASKEYQERLAGVWSKHGVNPLKSMGGILVQAPLFICFFSGLRHMAAAKVSCLGSGQGISQIVS